MTKLKLKFATSDEILSREEMKQVFGGYMSGSGETGSSTCYWFRCKCSNTDSMMAGSTMSTFVKGSTMEEARSNAESECSNYKNIDCKRDKPC